MKTLIVCALMIVPSCAMAQVTTSGSLSPEDLTRALNTSPPRAITPIAGKTSQDTPVQPQSAPHAVAPSSAVPSAQNQPRPTSQAVAPSGVRPTQASASSQPIPPSPTAPLRQDNPAPVAGQISARPAAVSQPTRVDSKPEARPPVASESVRAAPVKASPSVPEVSNSAPETRDPQAPAQSSARPSSGSAAVSPPASTPAAPTPQPAPVAASGVLSRAAMAELPFEIELPVGVQLAAVNSARDARVWAVRKGPTTLAMIFAGTQSQFPIFEGEQLTVAGRTSVVLNEGSRRIAVEHLFQRTTAPQELHIWVMATEGADRDLAERIAQTLDYK